MERNKINRGGSGPWPPSPRNLIAALALAGAAALPGVVQAQGEIEACGGSLTNAFIAPTPPSPRFIGETLRVRATVNNTVADPWRVDLFEHKLDCANAGNFFVCADEGEVMNFVGNVSTNCQDAGDNPVTWAAVPAGNLVTFTPSNPVVLDAVGGSQTSCVIDFDIQIASLSTDASPGTISGANNAQGECFDGLGNFLPGSAQGSVATAVATCGITLKKQVSDGEGGWLDADNAVDGDGEDVLKVIFKDADPFAVTDTGDVLYRLLVKNTGTATMSSVLVDDTALGITDAEVGPLAAGEEKTVTSGQISALNALGRCVALGDLENISSATGVCRATAPVVDDDASNNAWVRCVGVPRIDILKEVSLDGLDWRDANLPTDADVPEGEFGAHAYYRITVKNTGSVDLENVVVNDLTLGITDHPVGDLAVGAEVVLTSGEIGALFVEGRCDRRGNLDNTAQADGFSVEDGTKVTDTDPAVLRCVGEPDISILKEISVDGLAVDDPAKQWFDANAPGDLDTPTVAAPHGAMYRFTVTNTGNVPLVNQQIEDVQLGITPPVAVPGTLNPGASYVLDSGDLGWAALDVAERCGNAGTFINTASVTADPIDGGDAVSDTDPATLVCTGNDLCLTRTPGFWGTHPHVTEEFLDIEVCGLPIDNTEEGNGSSSAEAMCMSGQDAKKGGSNMHYLQLVRQLTAAKLNIAASATNEGTCDTVGGVDIDALIERCEAAALCGDSGAKGGKLITASGCIEALDVFNNSDDTLDVFGPFVRPGPAAPGACQAANGNGTVVK